MEESNRNSIKGLREGATNCRDYPLWKNATQTVFGKGSARAEIVMVGEQPGDKEDIQGEPFVGPAGRLLDRAPAEAGIDRRMVYLTNTVKHFKFVLRGKRRMHKTPAQKEIAA
jgi:uracil-DNA glycosylase